MTTMREQKFAEKLIILNSRVEGLMARLHFLKRLLVTQSRPPFLPGGEKTYESALKALIKKFPNIDSRSNRSALQPLTTIKNDIVQKLEVHYYTIVDVLETRDEVLELFGRISGAYVNLDININFDLTRHYLDLMANYFSLMMMLHRLEDKKIILCLFSFAHEMTRGPEPSFPRSAEILCNFDAPFQQLHSDMHSHANLLKMALLSLYDTAAKRFVNVVQESFLFVDNPESMRNTPAAESVLCDLISLDTLERWIVFGFLLIYTELNDASWKLWRMALANSFIVVLYRDEVIHIHPAVLDFFETIRNYNKRCDEMRDIYRQVLSKAALEHRQRRRALRDILREMFLVLSDEPGYLGPKVLVVLMALCAGRDEVTWLLRHSQNPPPKKVSGMGSTIKVNPDDFRDDHLTEMIFYIERLRRLVLRYHGVILHFHSQMLHTYDLPALSTHLKSVSLPGEDAMLLDEMLEELQKVKSPTPPTILQAPLVQQAKLMATRLDWFRLQTYLSPSTGPFRLCENRKFGALMNAMILHTRTLDDMEELLREVSDMSVFCFYQETLTQLFENSLRKSPQHRYLMAYPLLCAHFMTATHSMCPEERAGIGQTSFQVGYKMSAELCNRVITHVRELCLFRKDLEAALAPKESVILMSVHKAPKRGGKKSAAAPPPSSSASGIGSNTTPATMMAMRSARSNSLAAQGKGDAKSHGKGGAQEPQFQMPGAESYRKYRDEDFDILDQTLMVIADICSSINAIKEFRIWDRGIVMAEIMQLKMEEMFYELIRASARYQPEEKTICQPSELLMAVRTYMNVLNQFEYMLGIDATRVFENVFKQVCLLVDPYKCTPTITHFYILWYRDVLLHAAFQDQILYSPLLKSFVTNPLCPATAVHPEEYADLNELRALVDLMGPLGMRQMFEALMVEVTHDFMEIHQIVLLNSKTLEKLRSSFARVKETRELLQQLQDVDKFLMRLKRIGICLAFRDLCAEALQDVLKQRTPFLLASVKELFQANSFGAGILPPRHESRLCFHPDVCRLAAGFGYHTEVDMLLCEYLQNALFQLQQQTGGAGAAAAGMGDAGDYWLACLLMVFIACTLPRVLQWEHSRYRPELDAHDNNMHCLALAINSLLTALFINSKSNDLDVRMKEFVALSSLHMLRHGPATLLFPADGSGGSHSMADSTDFLWDGDANSSASNGSNAGSSAMSNSLNAAAILGTAPTGCTSSMAFLSPQQRQQMYSLYVMLQQVISASPYVTAELLESCFPYALVRSAHHNVYQGTVNKKGVVSQSGNSAAVAASSGSSAK